MGTANRAISYLLPFCNFFKHRKTSIGGSSLCAHKETSYGFLGGSTGGLGIQRIHDAKRSVQ